MDTECSSGKDSPHPPKSSSSLAATVFSEHPAMILEGSRKKEPSLKLVVKFYSTDMCEGE